MEHDNPLNPLPPVILALVVVMILIEAALSLGSFGLVGGQRSVGWRIAAVEDWSFVPAVSDYVIGQGRLSLDLLKRFVTYPFVHGGFTHGAFAVVILLAMGKFVGEVLSDISLAVLFFACTIFGALVYGLVSPGNAPLYGAYPPAYGMIGAFSYIMWLSLKRMGENQLMAFRLIGVLFAIQLFWAIFFGGNPTWIADLAGFLVGFALAPVLAPGGLQALRDRLRQR